nr:hypothetical protein [Okeania sp. SIO2F4]
MTIRKFLPLLVILVLTPVNQIIQLQNHIRLPATHPITQIN